ncbi:MAG: HNH endonuclease [Parcubacteria group bacterium]|nr:HNH endonuclease [Parcubacteria group bacterium]
MNKFQYSPPKNAPKSSEELIEDLQLVAKKLNTRKITQKLYTEHGKFNCSTFINRFGTWNKSLLKAGLQLSNIVSYSDEKLFENILNVWQKKGAQPTRRDMNTTMSEISSGAYNRRFSSWTSTIKEFIAYANSKEISAIKNEASQVSGSKTSRDPSLRLRFHVLKRDNFSCVQCGASPAKDQKVVLHIDHIKPWSKGGETEISNLQTLCQNCNLGKSNIE